MYRRATAWPSAGLIATCQSCHSGDETGKYSAVTRRLETARSPSTVRREATRGVTSLPRGPVERASAVPVPPSDRHRDRPRRFRTLSEDFTSKHTHPRLVTDHGLSYPFHGHVERVKDEPSFGPRLAQSAEDELLAGRLGRRRGWGLGLPMRNFVHTRNRDHRARRLRIPRASGRAGHPLQPDIRCVDVHLVSRILLLQRHGHDTFSAKAREGRFLDQDSLEPVGGHFASALVSRTQLLGCPQSCARSGGEEAATLPGTILLGGDAVRARLNVAEIVGGSHRLHDSRERARRPSLPDRSSSGIFPALRQRAEAVHSAPVNLRADNCLELLRCCRRFAIDEVNISGSSSATPSRSNRKTAVSRHWVSVPVIEEDRMSRSEQHQPTARAHRRPPRPPSSGPAPFPPRAAARLRVALSSWLVRLTEAHSCGPSSSDPPSLRAPLRLEFLGSMRPSDMQPRGHLRQWKTPAAPGRPMAGKAMSAPSA